MVSVPVLSRHSTSRDAASSMESRRVTSTPFLTSSMAPTACTIVRTAGSATGTAPMRKITAKVTTVRIPIFISRAPTATAASAAIAEVHHVPHDGEHDLFLVGLRPRDLHELRRPAEVGAAPRVDHQALGLAALHDRARVEDVRRAGLHGKGFARQRGLVHRQRAAQDLGIRRDDVAHLDHRDVSRHDLGCVYGHPPALAPHRGIDGQPFLEQLEGSPGASGMQVADDRVRHDQDGDDDGFQVMSQENGERRSPAPAATASVPRTGTETRGSRFSSWRQLRSCRMSSASSRPQPR